MSEMHIPTYRNISNVYGTCVYNTMYTNVIATYMNH